MRCTDLGDDARAATQYAAAMPPTQRSAKVMKRLEQLGDEGVRKIYARHGVIGPTFGVRYADLYALQKELGVDHALALELFDCGNHEARILATLIADPEAFTLAQLDAWQRACEDHVVNGAVATIAACSTVARTLAKRWSAAKQELRAAAGWHIIGSLSAPGTDADDAWLQPYLAQIQAGIHGAPNRTRSAMNTTLISIGGYRPALRDEALAVAKAIGKVEVDHGDTSCKTPDAVAYIEKMAVRHSKRAAKKAPAKKTSAKKTSAKKTPAKKPAAKKAAAKKPSAKKPSAKKAAAKKPAAKKTAAKKPAAKKTAAKKKSVAA